MKKQKSKKRAPSLRQRMTLLVAVELVLVSLISYLLDILVPDNIFARWDEYSPVALVVVSLLIGTVLTWFLSRMFFDPIKKLNKAMGQVAEGDFSVRLSTKSSSDEIREIYSGFNLMAQELGHTEILQTDFVSNASHEFKTPLNAIEGYSTLLQNSGNLTHQQQEYVEKIIFNTRRLSSLTGSILLLSKIENQSIPTKQSHFRLDEQIRQSILALEPEWEEKEISFDVELEEISYFGNENLLHHVWDNLISNAIKFNPPGGSVAIGLTRNGENLTCTVADTGPGIPEDARKHIFDKFYQADSSHREQGNGLGLALVKQIVALEGGNVWAENLPQGGCRFTVSLKVKSI